MSGAFFPIFMVGLLGSVHCIGMCGGIVGAFTASTPTRRPFPVAVTVAGNQARALVLDNTLRILAYNIGRISSYMLAGALAGGLADGVRTLSGLSSFQIALYWLANLMLIALGLYLMDVWRGLVRLESLGALLWRRVQFLLKYLLPVDHLGKALALGGLWGWVPCGMVYSALLTAALSGSASGGALTMLAFGLGTLPMLLALGAFGARLRETMQIRSVRLIGGLVVLLFGVVGMLRAVHGVDIGWLAAFCLTPPGGGHP
ncbi:MAG: sulfite exporter TauE/SafE family protein [Proteobacteria bacterium]|nr:sulfite exporter TauE/SafE family protein [Pseudomonadota bacterium]